MKTAFVLILAFTVINVLATRRVARSKLSPHRKFLLTTGVWIIPFIGAWTAYSATTEPAAPPPPAPLREREEAPDVIDIAGSSFPVNEHLLDGQGFPILDWPALAKWTEALPDEHRTAALESGRRAWLLHLRNTLGEHAHLVETKTAWVLSSYEPKVAEAVARYVETTRARIAELLDGIAGFPEGHRSIVLVLDHQDDYYHYITNYYPDEGEFSYSSGVFIDPGCPHFVTVIDDLSVIEPVIAHEMTHAALAYLRLPKWLDEGIAVSTEHRISTSHHSAQHAVELIGKHRAFWNAETMQQFWSGSSFDRGDDGNALSYDLARHIVGLIGREWSAFTKFVRGAKREDSGAASAKAQLDLDLGQLAAAAVGLQARSGWSPDPARWEQATASAAQTDPK
jgi:hypothetical protein